MIATSNLWHELHDAALPVVGVANPSGQSAVNGIATWHTHGTLGMIRLDWESQPTAQQEADADAIVQAFDPTPPTLKERAVTAFNDAQADAAMRDRAIVLTAMDSDNVLRKFTRDLLTQIAAATSLADLKTRCANNLPVLAALDGADAKAAIGAKIDGGGAD